MHIPDGMLDPTTIIVTYAIAMLTLIYTMLTFRKNISELDISKIAGLAGSIFVAQLIKWPVPGGSTLHLVGGGLACMISGPIGGFIAMATVLFVQTFVFHDGGITAFGANLISAGLAGVFGSYAVYLALRRFKVPFPLAAFTVGYICTIITGVVAGFILGVSGEILGSPVYNLSITPKVMLITHTVLGSLEGFITMGVTEYIRRKNPSIVYRGY